MPERKKVDRKNEKKSLMRRKRKKKNYVVILVGIIAVLYVITEIAPGFIDAVTPTTVIEYGDLIVEDEVTCYILRDEDVYSAPYNANIEYSVSEGQLVKVGTGVVKCEKKDDATSSKSGYDSLIEKTKEYAITENVENAGKKGIFSTIIDGEEKFFTEENYENITESKASQKAGQEENMKLSEAVKGQPLYKIVNQSDWYVMCWIESGSISKYQVDKVLYIDFGDTRVKFTVSKIDQEGSKWKMLLHSNRYYSEFASARTCEARIVASDTKGLIVPNSCIGVQDDKAGVSVVDKNGDISFVPVNVLATDGENSVVSENIYYDSEGNLVNTVSIYDEILKKPVTEQSDVAESEKTDNSE